MAEQLYYMKYNAEYECYIPASSTEEAVNKMNEITDYGTKDMHCVRYNEGGWNVVEELGELIELDQDNPDERDDFNTHKTQYGQGHFGEADYGVWFDA